MRWFNSILILLAAYLGVYLESSVDILRRLCGAQPDVLPALVLYAALKENVVTVLLTAFFGGLWFDSLSANNLGVSTLSLLAVGLALHQFRGLLLRDEWIAQFCLGAAASLLCPVLSLLLLMSLRNVPLLAWSSAWQLLVTALAGGVCAPFLFRLFPRLDRALNYQPAPEPGFRPDRQIKRGRH